MTIQISSDVIGPVPPDGELVIDVFPITVEEPCGGWAIQPWDQHNGLARLEQGNYYLQSPLATVADGAEVTVKTKIVTVDGTFDEGTTTGLHWSTTGNLPELLREVTDAFVPSGGFVQTDRDILNAIYDAVFRTWRV